MLLAKKPRYGGERAPKLCNLTLGDVKALLYISTLENFRNYVGIGTKEQELAL